MSSRQLVWFLALVGFGSACSSSSSSPEGNGGFSGTAQKGSSGGTSDGGSGTNSRIVVGCSEYGSMAAEANGGTYQAGSWGTIPAALQAVPPGGTFCGTVVMDAGSMANFGTPLTLLATDLQGQELFDFYSPLVAQLPGSCTLAPVNTITSGTMAVSSTSYSCAQSKANGGMASDSTYQAIEIWYSAP